MEWKHYKTFMEYFIKLLTSYNVLLNPFPGDYFK